MPHIRRSGADQPQPVSVPRSPPFPSPRGRARVCCGRLVPAVRRLIFETKPTRGSEGAKPSQVSLQLAPVQASPTKATTSRSKSVPTPAAEPWQGGPWLLGVSLSPTSGPALPPERPSVRPCVPCFFRAEWAHQPFPINPCPSFPGSIKNTIGFQSIWVQETSGTPRQEDFGSSAGGWAIAKAKNKLDEDVLAYH